MFIISTDTGDAPLMSDLSADLFGLEVESWSFAVSPEFCRRLDRRTIKRQDVIYGETILPFFLQSAEELQQNPNTLYILLYFSVVFHFRVLKLG